MQKEEKEDLFKKLMKVNSHDCFKRLIEDVETISSIDDKELINWAYFYRGCLMIISDFSEYYCGNYKNNFDDNNDEHLKDFFSKIKSMLAVIESNNTNLK